MDHRQQVWVGTRDEGLFQFQTNHFQPAPGAEILGPQIFALFEDHQGQLWAGTQKGLARWNGTDWKMFTTPDGLVVRAIAEDAEGNLWIGTESSGLNFFKAGKLIAYQATAGGLPGNDISCLYVDKDGVTVDWHLRPWPGPILPGKVDSLFHERRPRQQQHQLHHRR